MSTKKYEVVVETVSDDKTNAVADVVVIEAENAKEAYDKVNEFYDGVVEIVSIARVKKS